MHDADANALRKTISSIGKIVQSMQDQYINPSKQMSLRIRFYSTNDSSRTTKKSIFF